MNIEKGYIQKLLDSYLAAETTREEEDLLADYFCTHRDVPRSQTRQAQVRLTSQKLCA